MTEATKPKTTVASSGQVDQTVMREETMTSEEYILQAGLTRCEFDDECDKCENPSGGTWAKICHIPEDVSETEYYICGACIEAKANNVHNA